MSSLFFSKTKEILHLALPLGATLLAQMGLGVVDTVMMGHLGVAELAAGSLSQAAFTMVLVFFVGVMSAVGILVARNYGAKNEKAISENLSQGIYIALFLGIFGMLALWGTPTFYLSIGQDKAIVELARQYLFPLSFGMPAILLYILSREFLAVFLYARIVMIIAIAVIPLGIALNYIFMYGKLGLPALGIQGIAIATVIIQWGMLFVLGAFIFKKSDLKQHIKLISIDKKQLMLICKLGFPIGIMMLFEEGLFAVSAIMMGYFGEISLAAHQITLLCVSFFFMIQLGLSQAAAILIAKSLGAKQAIQAKQFVYGAILLGLGVAAMTAILYILLPKQLSLFFMRADRVNVDVIRLATQFFIIAAVFQFFDSIQVISVGALRGYKDTFVPMCLGGLSYWIFGLSFGYLSAFHWGVDGAGLWWGLAIGIGISAVLLLARLKRISNLE